LPEVTTGATRTDTTHHTAGTTVHANLWVYKAEVGSRTHLGKRPDRTGTVTI
jgi:hypothetical protein